MTIFAVSVKGTVSVSFRVSVRVKGRVRVRVTPGLPSGGHAEGTG